MKISERRFLITLLKMSGCLIPSLIFVIGILVGENVRLSGAYRELSLEIATNRDEINTLNDRLIYLQEWATMETWTSYYGESHRGKLTASGKPFNPDELTAASPWLPFGKRVRVTRVDNGLSVTVRITDRGPHPRLGRGLDLSRAAAAKLGMIREGVIRVRVGPVQITKGE